MFNKSEIMRRAWAIVKKGSEWQKYRLRRLRYALQDAWGEAKRTAKAETRTIADKPPYCRELYKRPTDR